MKHQYLKTLLLFICISFSNSVFAETGYRVVKASTTKNYHIDWGINYGERGTAIDLKKAAEMELRNMMQTECAAYSGTLSLSVCVTSEKSWRDREEDSGDFGIFATRTTYFYKAAAQAYCRIETEDLNVFSKFINLADGSNFKNCQYRF